MPETQEEKKDPRATRDFWKKEPHNCTDKEADVQISKYASEQEKQNQ